MRIDTTWSIGGAILVEKMFADSLLEGLVSGPSWDPEDAYKDTNVTHRPAAHDLFRR